jgi:hypothetical protein
MDFEVRLWRADGDALTRVIPSTIESEKLLENLLESDPSLLGEHLLIIGRQVETSDHGFVDLLAIDAFGTMWLIELKRERTQRAVIGQIVDYGTWVITLSRDEIIRIFRHYRHGARLEDAFYEYFGKALPNDLNKTHRLLVAAVSVNEITRQNVHYLQGFDVPIQVVLFQHFEVNGVTFLARAVPTRGEASLRPQRNMSLAALGSHKVPAESDESPKAGSIPTRLYDYRTGLYEAHRQARDFWERYCLRFKWDFLLPSFLFARHEKWRSKERAAGRPRLALPVHVLMQRLRDIVRESGDWQYTQASPPHLMTAFEPLAESLRGWEPDGSKTPTRGFRRIRARQRPGEVPETPES